MSEQKRVLEAQGPDVEAAIETGLARLGVSRDDVEVEVLDRGSRGLLGLGSRDASVRLIVRGGVRTEPQKKEADSRPVATQPKTPLQPAAEEKRAAPPPPPEPVREAPQPEPVTRTPQEIAGELSEEQTVALQTVSTLLEKLQVTADVSVSLSEPDERTGRQVPVIAVEGDDLSILIGPRGETLQALQFVTRLMVGHEMRQRTSFVIDVAGYRDRRKQSLTRLAERMASKVIKRNRAVTLEPMPPNERRLIHIALRDNEDVYTQSTGEGDRRRVRIYPKE